MAVYVHVVLLKVAKVSRLSCNTIDLKRITRHNLGIVRVGHFWKCYGSKPSKP